MNSFRISGNIVDLFGERVFSGTVTVENGRIAKITEDDMEYRDYIMPGFIDSHVHIESSMLTPAEFARLAVVHGTVASVSDPHEIANVLGKKGIRFMIDNGKKVPFKFYFGAPSCVPATGFETSGAEITAADIDELLAGDEIKYLSEMMNFPGVLFDAPEVLEKINIAKKYGKPVDGHAPGLMGEQARKYISAGISTDHESYSIGEALDKISSGMKILIREGSAAKNFNALYKLIDTHPGMCMLCSDDKHPDDLVEGHINRIAALAVSKGLNLFNILKASILNPVEHYRLPVGLLREGDDADFIVVENIKDFKVLKTYIRGSLVAENGKSLINHIDAEEINIFRTSVVSPEDFCIDAQHGNIRVIEAMDGELITNELITEPKIDNGHIVPDIDRDILKLAVVNRYGNKKPSVGFIRSFGLKKGAAATSVAHDSHNIIAVGTNDNDLCEAVNAVIKHKGGLAVADDGQTDVLPLPVAGLISSNDGYKTASKYSELDKRVKALGSGLNAPFMTLSFMALLVIPKLKLSDKGLFNGEKFEFTNLFTE